MSKRDELITKYAKDLKDKCGVSADMELLKKVVIGCGPTIYRDDSSTVSGTDKEEVARIRTNFLLKKLMLKDGPDLDAGIAAINEQYGKSNRNKYRAVFYYLLVKHFKRESVYA